MASALRSKLFPFSLAAAATAYGFSSSSELLGTAQVRREFPLDPLTYATELCSLTAPGRCRQAPCSGRAQPE